jgi:hypothetical protein
MVTIQPIPLTYCELFAEPASNPFGAEEEEAAACIASVYLNWRTTSELPDVDAVEDDLISDFSRPIGGIGMFAQHERSATGVLEVLHGFQMFPGVPCKTGRERKQLFCYVGDVLGVDLHTVAFDEEQLETTMAVNVPATIDRVLQLLGEEPNNEAIGPFRVGDANVRTITSTRGAMYIPYQYMSLVLGMELTGRKACLLLLPAIINDGLQQVCKPLVDFLVVRITKGANDLNAPRTMQPHVGRRDFHPSPAVISHRREHVLHRQLPGLRPTAATAGDPALVGIASSMHNIASDMHHDLVVRETRYAEAKKPSTLQEKHGDRTSDMLLLLTRSTDDEDLSEYYLNISGKPKGLSERVILQREVDASSQVLDLVPFQVTLSQVIAMKTFDFTGASYSEIGTGVLPFSITPADATSDKGRAVIRADRGRAETFDLSDDSVNGAMTTDDATRMLNYKGYIASDWMEARLQIRSVACLMGALLGTTHPVLMYYKVFLRKYDLMEPRVQREFELVHGSHLGPALVVFHVQLM